MKVTTENQRQGNQKVKQFLLNVLLGISILTVLMAIANLVLFKSEDAFLFGYKPYIVASESMEPTFKKYSLVLIKKGGYDDIKAGAVIAFHSSQISGQTALHRVGNVTPNGFLTQGDANKAIDRQLVTRSNFLGHEVWHTNLTAALYSQLQAPQKNFLIILFPCLLIVVLCIAVKTVRKRLKQKNAGAL